MNGTAQGPTVNILLADDDADERYFFEAALKELPTKNTLVTMTDGEKLMKYLTQIVGLPDVLFLDIMMPRKNGIECLTEIKNNEKLKMIPVVMYSNSVGDDYVNICYGCGASYFLQKGIYSELTESITKLLSILATIPARISRDKFKFSLSETYV